MQEVALNVSGQSPKPGQQLLKTLDAATYIGLSRSTLEKLRCAGKGPRFVRLASAVRYRPQDLDDWLNGGVVETEDSRRQQARA